MRRDRRVGLCVDDERPPYSYVMLEGEVSISDDLDEMLVFATRIAGRYMGADRAEEFGRRNAVAGEVLVRVRPTRVSAIANVAD
jgi:PPOX class probable F420-dependent enzyme